LIRRLPWVFQKKKKNPTLENTVPGGPRFFREFSRWLVFWKPFFFFQGAVVAPFFFSFLLGPVSVRAQGKATTGGSAGDGGGRCCLLLKTKSGGQRCAGRKGFFFFLKFFPPLSTGGGTGQPFGRVGCSKPFSGMPLGVAAVGRLSRSGGGGIGVKLTAGFGRKPGPPGACGWTPGGARLGRLRGGDPAASPAGGAYAVLQRLADRSGFGVRPFWGSSGQEAGGARGTIRGGFPRGTAQPAIAKKRWARLGRCGGGTAFDPFQERRAVGFWTQSFDVRKNSSGAGPAIEGRLVYLSPPRKAIGAGGLRSRGGRGS